MQSVCICKYIYIYPHKKALQLPVAANVTDFVHMHHPSRQTNMAMEIHHECLNFFKNWKKH